MAKGRVTAPGLNMHLAPGSDEIVHTLAKGDEVAIIKTEQHTKLWHFVWFRKDDFAKYGWVVAEHVELVLPPVSPYRAPAKRLEQLDECDEVPLGMWIAGAVVVLAIVGLVVGALLK
jgi:hypothetical protein